MELFEIGWGQAWKDFVKIVISFLLALPIAWNRERGTNIMGIRTFPLVAIGACAFLVVAKGFIGDDSPDALARIIQGLLGGIGFIGGGAILKNGDHVSGTASAASIWMMGALGVSVAMGRLDVAIILSLANLLVLQWLTPLKRKVTSDDE